MKALVLEEYNKLVYRDFPDPKPADNEVLVKIKACGICGSDIHGMDGSTGRRIPPLIMGHEASGVIVEVGSGVKNWKPGDRVTFDSTIYPLDDWYTLKGHYNLSDNRQVLGVSPGTYKRHGAFAEFVNVPEHILYKIPDNVSFEEAAMTEPIAVAAHAVQLSKIRTGESALVVGAGMVGVFVIQLLKIAGCYPVIAVDPNPERLKLSLEHGADAAFSSELKELESQILLLTNQKGADTGFDVAGINESVQTCINLIRKGGTAVLIGNLAPQIKFPLQKVVTQEIKIQGSCAINGEYELVLQLMSQKKIKVEKMITAVAPLAEGAKWFERLYNKEPGLNKVLLVPDQD